MSEVAATQEAPLGWRGSTSFHVAFASTGAYTTLLGTALPLLAARWGLHDSGAGALFLAQFAGSTAGAYLRVGGLLRSVAAGFAGVAGASLLLAALAARAGVSLPLVLVALFVFGLGLGTAMTSTSVWMSEAAGGRSASVLASLNAVWAMGAGATPWLLLPAIRAVGSIAPIFLAAALPAAVACAVLMLVRQGVQVAARAPHAEQASARTSVRTAAAVGYLSFAAVGCEAALAGWMVTYIGRMSGASTALTFSSASAASAFWLGLLGGRVVSSLLLLTPVRPRSVAVCSATLALCGAALLLSVHAPAALTVVAGATGAGIGPLYPLVLSTALRLAPGRSVFMLAGLGSALVPWGTGLLSSAFRSLAAGLALPLVLLLGLWLLLLVRPQLTAAGNFARR